MNIYYVESNSFKGFHETDLDEILHFVHIHLYFS